jgi:2-oxoglutarate dehydrogenase E1 component
VCWVQEEPENMGAWPYLVVRLGNKLFDSFPLSGITRPPSSTPASGSHRRHKQEQKEIIERAFKND